VRNRSIGHRLDLLDLDGVSGNEGSAG
jgi:hypothetical protein